ncbi:hypothetical protein B0T16DRAFT_329256 [Cercophora newfieldiana]|uniref:Uncharacterized protein n=1 Tax=Cercophora newfieldiana TaxID=92897 RepID=A0AA39Y6S9_9PEZI|nr:hypothetical protein B0T16DRAFT_329256 [Cercophora newfieldiana]
MTSTFTISEEDTSRAWQRLMDQGRTTLARRTLEVSLHHFTTALHMCETYPGLAKNKYLVLGNLGWISRLSGKYPQAIETLEQALALADALPGPPTRERVQIAGELGTIYRLMDRHEDAQRVFAEQYKVAKGMDLRGATCRAIGNLGMANYQRAAALWEQQQEEKKEKENGKDNPDVVHQVRDLVKLAMEQLQERIQRASVIESYEDRVRGSHGSTTRGNKARGWATTGHCRLSLCSTLLASIDPKNRHEMLGQAEEHAETGFQRANYDTGLTFSRFFLGRVLLQRGRKDEALEYFDAHKDEKGSYWYPKMSTPAILFSKEHSNEHRGYLRELVDAGADLDTIDDEGYDALEYTIFNGDRASEDIIINGLRKRGVSESKIKERLDTAHLRKGYREIFQEKLRPLLYQGKKDTIKNIRRVYAETIAADAQKSKVFDHLKYIRYTDFENFGRLPRSSDGLVRSFKLGPNGEDDNHVDLLIFFSYRWINTDRSLNTPDDAEHTQYRRMLLAVEQFLGEPGNQWIEREKLCIWMDFACVDQDDPSKGVSSLPIIITQCDLTISLIDDQYFERAWCCVEAKMAGALVYGRETHKWYEQIPVFRKEDDGKVQVTTWELQQRINHYVDMENKKLTFESDRPKVVFLGRQSTFLELIN